MSKPDSPITKIEESTAPIPTRENAENARSIKGRFPDYDGPSEQLHGVKPEIRSIDPLTPPAKNDMGNVDGVRVADSISRQQHTLRPKPLVGAYVALLLLVVVYVSRPGDWIPGLSRVPLAKLSGFLALITLVFSLWYKRQRVPREALILVMLVGQLFLSAALSPVWRGGAFQATLDFAKVLLIVLLIATTVTTLQRLRVLIFVQAASVSTIAAVTIWKGRLILGRLEGALGGNYADPNDLALALAISVPLCLALLFLSRNGLWKILWAISILMMAYAICLTGSRSGFLALAFAVAISLWGYAIRGGRRYLLPLAALAGFILWQLSGGMLVSRFRGTFNIEENTAAAYASAQARQQLFLRSVEVTKEHPFFGVGPGNFDQVSGQWHTTHNSLTLMSAEGGVPALILYVLILWSGFRNLKATKRSAQGRAESTVLARALLASLAGYSVGSLFLSVSYEFFPYILVAYTTALFSITRKSATLSRKNESTRQITGEKKLSMDMPEAEMSSHSL
jgi:putative inorganic carbon (HCO3(-)) transporter